MAMGSFDIATEVPSAGSINMNYEKRRLETFTNWPSNAVIDPGRIAKAGFYSTGNELEVKCFSCGKIISEWEYGDQVMAKHRQINPDCSFVKDPLECGNVPLLPAVGLHQVDYRKETERLASFRGWTSPHVTPESLARNGLYYLREDDKVACAFCSVVLHNWEAGDLPLREHRRASPECPLLFGNMVGNVPIDVNGSGIMDGEEDDSQDDGDSPGSSDPSSPQPYVEIRPFAASGNEVNKQLASNPQFGVQTHRPPIHARYQTYEARLATFTDWPNALPTPTALANAGFYYQGMLDHACCFHCNGGLHNWDPADDPWEEHARWFSRCPFVGIVKGRDFVQSAIAKKPPIIPISQVVAPPCGTEEGEDVTGITDTSAATQQQSRTQPEDIDTSSQSSTVVNESMSPPQVPSEPIPESSSVDTATVAGTSGTQKTIATNTEQGAVASLDMSRLSLQSNAGSDTCELVEENRRLTEARLCKVCLDEDVGVVFLPCGHLITCVKCAPNLAHCPMCRDKIQASVRTFFS